MFEGGNFKRRRRMKRPARSVPVIDNPWAILQHQQHLYCQQLIAVTNQEESIYSNNQRLSNQMVNWEQLSEGIYKGGKV